VIDTAMHEIHSIRSTPVV